jgi:hypothetical protein
VNAISVARGEPAGPLQGEGSCVLVRQSTGTMPEPDEGDRRALGYTDSTGKSIPDKEWSRLMSAPFRRAVSRGPLTALSLGLIVAACGTGGNAPAPSATQGPVSQDQSASSPAAETAPTRPRTPANAVNVPTSIDATGSSDVSSQLQAFINSAPNGSTIVFKAKGTYQLDEALRIIGRRNLTLDGNGARLNLPTVDQDFNSIGIQVRDGSVGTTIRDFVMVGNNSQAGTSDACCTRENNHAIAVLSATDTLIEGMDIRRTWGDCLYISRVAGGTWADGVTFRDSTCQLSGRHGVGIIAASQVRIVNNVFDEIGFDVIDLEPNQSSEGASDVVVRGNTIGSYAISSEWDGWLMAACGPKDLGAVIRDVTVTGNTIEGNLAGWSGRTKALHFKICGERGPRLNFTVTDNVAQSAVDGPAMTFTEVDGVTVSGNTQPLSRGQLATFPGSTDVTYEP